MIRMSALRNVPVICGEKQLGLLQAVSLDEAQKRVCALIISCGLRSKRMVLPEAVLSIADGFILAKRAEKYRRSMEKTPCAFVRDSTGLLCGRVTDYALDESLNVQAVEIMPGYWPSERRSRIWAFTWHRTDDEALSVPACLGSERIVAREGSEPCACPP